MPARFRRRYPKVQITILAPDDVLLVPMDALLITQVLNNLLKTPIAMEEVPTLKLRWRCWPRMAWLSFRSPTTAGIAASQLAHLFEIQPAPFSGGRLFPGLGIGLSLQSHRRSPRWLD